MKRVLVTGSDGQLGRSIRKLASNYPKLELIFKNYEKLDITDISKVDDIVKNGQYHFCINCAAYTDVDKAESEQSKAFAVNAEGIRNLAESCYKNGVVLIHISTDYVFDGTKQSGYTIDDIPNPINIYGASKLKGEQYIQEILCRYVIVRTSWLYSKKGKNFYTTILAKARKGEKLRVTDEQVGCPTRAKSLARFLLDKACEDLPQYGLYHFTDGIAMTWYEFAKKILLTNGLENEVILERAKNCRTFARRPANSILK